MQRKEIRLQYDFKELGSKHTIYFLLSIEITQLELSLFHFCDNTIHINIAILRCQQIQFEILHILDAISFNNEFLFFYSFQMMIIA